MDNKEDLYYFKKVLKKSGRYYCFKLEFYKCIQIYLQSGYQATYRTMIGKSYLENPHDFINQMKLNLRTMHNINASLSDIIEKVLRNTMVHSMTAQTQILNELRSKYKESIF